MGALFLFAGQARAQEGFALDRFDPAAVGSDWFDGDSLDFRGHGRGALGLTANYAHKPLVARDSEGNTTAAPVRNQFLFHLGGAVNIWDRLRLEMMLPLAVWNSGTAATVGGIDYPAPNDDALGDLRMGADVRLYGEYQSPFSLAAGLRMRLPTGSRSAYMSDGATQLGGRVLAAGDIEWFSYSARLGVQGRFNETLVNGVEVGTELNYGATAGVRFAEKKALLGAEWSGGAGLVGGSAFDPKTVPQELWGSFSYRYQEVIFGVAAGPGLTEGFGSPVVRGLARLVWFPEPKKPLPVEPTPEPAPPPDCDGDGVINAEDACPAVQGPKTTDPETNGCPPPKDTDGDGIVDSEDACVEEAGKANADPKWNGCPPDLDGDGILNEDDACPSVPGRTNKEPALNGCPVVVVNGDKIEILQRVEFVTNSAQLDPSSHELLNAVAEVLTEHPELELVEVEGHTDDKGSADYNRLLSKQRAESVKSYLVERGVAASRLFASGRGPDIPIASNDTEEDRATNRRVEFHIRRRVSTGSSGSTVEVAPGGDESE